MEFRRRTLLHLMAGAAALTASSRGARAQAYPSRPVRLVAGFPAGGTTDIVARVIGQWLSERLGQQFIVENRPGASTNIATEAVVRAPPDGHTLLITTTSNFLNATLFEKLSYNFIRDIAPITGLFRSPLVLEVIPTVPVNSVPKFIAYTKANPGKVNLASFGIGTISHLAGELFKITTGVETVHVPYRGSTPMVTDLLGGQVQSAFDNLPASIEHIRAGKLRALAVTTPARSHALPDIPTMGEFIPGYEASPMIGMGAPRGTPAEVIGRLNQEINAALADPKIKARFADLGGTPIGGSPAEFGKVIADVTEKWAKVIRTANIKVE